MSLISIIIPCYNYGKFLPDTLDSVLRQTYVQWECIIVNDGSSDNTEAVAREYQNRDKRIKYIYQHNKGLSAARNTGIKESNGSYLQFLDADDLIEAGKLKAQLQAFAENPEYDIVYSGVNYFRTQFPEERLHSMCRNNKKWMPNVSGSGKAVLKYLFERNIMAANCPLVKRTVFTQVGQFNENLKYLEDWEFWLRCALHNLNFFYLNKPGTLALVRIHENSMTNNTWEMRHTELMLKLDLKDKIREAHLLYLLEEQIKAVNKTLVGIAVYDFLKGNTYSFKTKLKTITEENTVGAATVKIIQNRYLPGLSIGKVWFYGKKLLVNNK
jgi:glycosyltransferase involved in cell wall biosynthesis